MLEKLTPDQEELIPVIVKKWIDWGTKQTETEVATIQKNMQALYREAGLGAVPVIVVDNLSQFVTEVESSVGSSVWSSVASSVWSSVRSSVKSSVRYSVWSSVWSSVKSSVRSSVKSSVRYSVWSSVRSSVKSSVRYSVWSSVRSSVESSVGSYYWADELSFYDFFKKIGIITESKLIEKVDRLTECLADVSFGFITDKTCIVLRKPKVRLNSEGVLHSDSQPSVEWPDGEHSLYHLNGVQFEKKLWEKVVNPETPLAEILAIEDVDQRAQALNPSFRKVDDVIKELKGKKLDEYHKLAIDGTDVSYQLYMFPAGDIFTEDAYYCLFDCPSTGKRHLEGVEKAKTVAECQAWAMTDEENGIIVTPDEWERMIPLIDEN